MDNNLRTVKKDDLKNFVYDIIWSYGIHPDAVNVDVNSLYIRLTFKEPDIGDTDDINSINDALSELFDLNVISSNPGSILDYHGQAIPLMHPFKIVE